MDSFPVTNYTVGDDGILCETFYSLTLSSRLIIPEDQVNEILAAWVEKQKQRHVQQQQSVDSTGEKIARLSLN